ncbi:hypothetical protein F5B21DRAFT_509062 [Xylaria acuta]|nr:hypothetical protein F5B21DRAFT_509062 [Xylaria acuta]
MSTTPTPPIPIVLVGIHTEIGEPVAEGLRPDFDVIRFIQTFSAAQSDLPHLLRGSAPPDAATNTVGSADYSRGGARAVLFGRGFSQRQAEELYAANKDQGGEGEGEGGAAVVWIAGAEANRPAGLPLEPPPPGIEKIMVPVFKAQLEKWVKGGCKGGLVLY